MRNKGAILRCEVCKFEPVHASMGFISFKKVFVCENCWQELYELYVERYE